MLEARKIGFFMGYLDDEVETGEKGDPVVEEQEERLPLGLQPPSRISTPPPPLLLPPAAKAKKLPLEQVEVRGNQQKEKKRCRNILVLVGEVSDCGDGAKEEEGPVDFWDKRDSNEKQWWHELVLAQSLFRKLRQPPNQQQQPQLFGAGTPTSWPSQQAPLPPQQSVEAP